MCYTFTMSVADTTLLTPQKLHVRISLLSPLLGATVHNYSVVYFIQFLQYSATMNSLSMPHHLW